MIKRTFIILSEAWYAEATLKSARYVDEIGIQVHDDAHLIGEFAITWHDLGQYARTHPRLESFNDSWYALSQCNDLIELLAELNDKKISPKKLGEALKGIGFEDVTPRSVPDHEE